MSEGGEIENPIEILNPNWELRFVVPIKDLADQEVTGPLIVGNENRDKIPLALSHIKLAQAADIKTFKRGFCKRDGENIVWVEPSATDKIGPLRETQLASKEQFDEALAIGIKIFNPPQQTG